MCVIIDTCVAVHALSHTPHPDYKPLVDWIYSTRECHGIVVHGGRLTDELMKIGNVAQTLKKLQQAGRARLIADERVRLEEIAIRSAATPRSNDIHVLAVARASGARLLCTNDTTGGLEDDFCNKSFLDEPRGRVYKYSSPAHKRLLQHSRLCQAPEKCRRSTSITRSTTKNRKKRR